MKKSYFSTALSLLLFLSSANSDVFARPGGKTMSTAEIVPFCRKIRCLFEEKYEPVLSKVANPENAKSIPLKEPIKKHVDDMSDMVKNGKTAECIALSSYALRLLEEDNIVSGVVLLDKFDDPENGRSVVVYKREVEIQGKKVEKWFVCDLSSAFLFWARSKIMDSSEAKNSTLRGIGLKDPKNALKSMADFLSIPLLYYFDGMGASKIYDAPKVLDCDRDILYIVPLTTLISVSLFPNRHSPFPIEIINVGTVPPINSVTIETSDYDKKILKFFDDLEFEHKERVVNEELIKKGINIKDMFKKLFNKSENK